MKEYTFTYYGWIPGYNDFDQDWITVETVKYESGSMLPLSYLTVAAESEELARKKVSKRIVLSKSEIALESVKEIK